MITQWWIVSNIKNSSHILRDAYSLIAYQQKSPLTLIDVNLNVPVKLYKAEICSWIMMKDLLLQDFLNSLLRVLRECEILFAFIYFFLIKLVEIKTTRGKFDYSATFHAVVNLSFWQYNTTCIIIVLLLGRWSANGGGQKISGLTLWSNFTFLQRP